MFAPNCQLTGVDIILGNDLEGGRVWPDNVRPDNLQILDVSIQPNKMCYIPQTSRGVVNQSQQCLKSVS